MVRKPGPQAGEPRRPHALSIGLILLALASGIGCERASRPDLDDPVSRTSITSASVSAGTHLSMESPTDQGVDRSEGDALRDAVLEDETLSASAQSVTFTAVDGTLVLHGRVENERERETLLSKARDVRAAHGSDVLAIRDALTVSHP